MQEALGLSRGLHVLSMMYEHNYEIALHAQNRLSDRIRSVIVPWPHITDGELDILTKSGVVGYRITWRLTKSIDQRMVARTTERGWSMHYLHRADDAAMDGWKPHILKTPGRFVLEHMGGVDPAKGINGEGFKFILQCLDTDRCWVKLSPRISKEENFPFSDVEPLVQKLVEYAPNRILWGSDWPHPQYFKPMPNDVTLLDQMLEWVPDETKRNKSLSTTRQRYSAFRPPADCCRFGRCHWLSGWKGPRTLDRATRTMARASADFPPSEDGSAAPIARSSSRALGRMPTRVPVTPRSQANSWDGFR